MRTVLLHVVIVLSLNIISAQDITVYNSNEVDEYPRFIERKCIQYTSSKECFRQQLNKHISAHFNYPIDALKKKITGNVYLQFIINEDGSINNIKARSKHKFFETEGIRIIELLPILAPAKIKGTNIAMYYNLPISFNMITDKNGKVKTKTVFIDIDNSKDSNSILSYNKVAKPPLIIGCQSTNKASDCFKEKLTDEIFNFMLENYPKKPEFSSKIYFEIALDNSIKNVIVLSPIQKTKESIEQFLNAYQNVLEPAKDSTGKFTECFFTTDMKLVSGDNNYIRIKN
ncbi:hypothetical protein GH721_13600 [Kriegella sp. EG-1]|nr:hypothetical protein [Flavobacteriaceae bacterium EG-1]